MDRTIGMSRIGRRVHAAIERIAVSRRAIVATARPRPKLAGLIRGQPGLEDRGRYRLRLRRDGRRRCDGGVRRDGYRLGLGDHGRDRRLGLAVGFVFSRVSVLWITCAGMRNRKKPTWPTFAAGISRSRCAAVPVGASKTS
jgi:hypothetical protein